MYLLKSFAFQPPGTSDVCICLFIPGPRGAFQLPQLRQLEALYQKARPAQRRRGPAGKDKPHHVVRNKPSQTGTHFPHPTHWPDHYLSKNAGDAEATLVQM